MALLGFDRCRIAGLYTYRVCVCVSASFGPLISTPQYDLAFLRFSIGAWQYAEGELFLQRTVSQNSQGDYNQSSADCPIHRETT